MTSDSADETADDGPAVDEFRRLLATAADGLAGIRGRLDAARCGDDAFGRLFEAHAVRDAYHTHLPEILRDLDGAREVAGHFVDGLDDLLDPPARIPEQRR